LDDLKGTTFSHLVKYSVATKINFYPLLYLDLISPTKSKSQITNGKGETIVTNALEGFNHKLA